MESNTKTRRRKRTTLQTNQDNQAQATIHPVGKNQSRFRKFSRRKQEGRLGKNFKRSQLHNTYKSSREQSKAVEKQNPKKCNFLEVHGTQHKDSKSKANKIVEQS